MLSVEELLKLRSRKDLLTFLEENKDRGFTGTNLVQEQHFNCSRSTLSFHLNKYFREGKLDRLKVGKEVFYYYRERK